MKKQKICGPAVPTANLAVNKGRLTVYNKDGDIPTYYLQKGQEFQIELFNPTKDVILAKIMLNGNSISQGGLVLNPGERIFLDRYIDVAKKFLFDTYEVENTEAVKEAIKANGDFRVEFFKERKYPTYLKSNVSYIPKYGSGTYSTSAPVFTTGTLAGGNLSASKGILRGSTSTSGVVGVGTTASNISGSLNLSSLSNGSLASTSISDTTAYYNTSSVTMDGMLSTLSMDSDYFIPCRSDAPKSKNLKTKRRIINESKTMETGRVEEGSHSHQTMKTVNKVFDAWYFHTIEYKMLPTSQKVYTSNDISVKRYCTDCGGRLGKTDKFCSKCGKKN